MQILLQASSYSTHEPSPGPTDAPRFCASFNIVYPIAMREAVAFQSNDYYAYQHELGDAGSVPKTYEHLWPEGGLTRAHYDAYIAVVAAMGVVRLPAMNHY